MNIDPNKEQILLETGTNELEVAEFGIYRKDKDILQSFGINVAKVREIIKMPSYIKMPASNVHVLGVFKLRDQIIPLINLSSWLNEKVEGVNYDDCVVIVTEFNKANFGFVVHQIRTIHRFSWEKVLPPANLDNSLINANINSITGIVPLKDRIMLMIDFEKIVGDINPNCSLSVRDDKAIVDEVTATISKSEYSKKIIVAEDSSVIRKMIRDILGQGGFEITDFNNGKDAWDFIHKNHLEFKSQNKLVSDEYPVLVADIEMPQMDGHSLCKKVKDDAELKSMSVILFSSLIYEEIRKKGERIGADAQISKPEIGKLMGIIKDLLEKKNAAS